MTSRASRVAALIVVLWACDDPPAPGSDGGRDEGDAGAAMDAMPAADSGSEEDAGIAEDAGLAEDAGAGADGSVEDDAGRVCVDRDRDGYGEGCALGPDCDDSDVHNHTDAGCLACVDGDGDGFWVGCDVFSDSRTGPDCDDTRFNVHTPSGCANCTDDDADGSWVGCDYYGVGAPGPDCDDGNPLVMTGGTTEICNGLSENCAGEIDNALPSEMCPPAGVTVPNVASSDGWACVPPSPGTDGCVIKNCEAGYHDVDGLRDNGCECMGTLDDCVPL